MAADGSAAPLGACPIKAEDMRKMHSDREAIGHRPGPGAKPVETVWVHYPGTELAFFDQERGRLKALPDDLLRPRGAGAVPLVPGESSALLTSLVERLLSA